MIEGFWQRADDFEAMFLPEVYSSFIGRDDGIKLHGLEAERHRLLLRVAAHRGGNAASTGVCRDYIAAVADMRSWSLLVGFKVIGPENALVLIFRDVGADRLQEPNLSGVLVGHFGIKGIGFARPEHGLQHAPKSGPVVLCGFAKCDHGSEVGNRQQHVADVLTGGDQIMGCANIIQRETGANEGV